MKRNIRALFIVVGCLVLAADVATLGYAFTRGGGTHMPRYPGRIAVRDGCGLEHMFFDGSDQRMLCLQDVFDAVSVSRNGEKLAWDTKGNAILVAGADAANPVKAPVPAGTNAVPSLAPDGEKVAFLHSPRDDGKYDIWITSTTKPDAGQVTNTRNVSDVAWSPTDDWLAFVQSWSDETLEGQLSLVRPNGDDSHTLVGSGDAPDWSPDGKKLVYVHNGSIWVVNSDGTDAHMLIRNGHSPAWSRDGDLIIFMRAENCAKGICPEHVYLAFTDRSNPHEVGPACSDERRLVWLPDPFE